MINLCECGCDKPLIAKDNHVLKPSIFNQNFGASVQLDGRWYLRKHATDKVKELIKEGDKIKKEAETFIAQFRLCNERLRKIKINLQEQGFIYD